MSTDNFQWTDELAEDFAKDYKKNYSKSFPIDIALSNFKITIEKSKQPKQERIEVLSMAIKKQWGDGKIDFECQLSYGISKDLFPAIKQAIESVLNNDTEDKDSIKVRAAYWKQVHDDLRFLEAELDANQDKIYTQSEVDAIREEVFYAAREQAKGKYKYNPEYCFTTFTDYLSSLNSKEEKPSPSVNDEWEILSVFADDGKPIYYPSKDILDTTLKNNGERIFSVIRKSDGEVFSVGDEVDVTCSDGKGFRDTISHFTFTKGANIIDVYFKEQLHTAFGVHWLNIAKHSPSPETPPIVKDKEEIKLPLSQIEHLYNIWLSTQTGKRFMDFVYSRVIF